MDTLGAIYTTTTRVLADPRSRQWVNRSARTRNADPVSMEHVVDMYDRIRTGDFSQGKLNRWLGWMQAVCVMHGVLTLDECKEINKRHA